jgi:hypothetical protein
MNVLGLDYNDALSQPTFNGHLMRANSSFCVQDAGLIRAPLERASVVSESDRSLIEGRTQRLYDTLLDRAKKV